MKNKVKREYNELWFEMDGSTKVWYVQAEKGKLSFLRKKEALAWQKASER
jgi:hypothetical protein